MEDSTEAEPDRGDTAPVTPMKIPFMFMQSQDQKSPQRHNGSAATGFTMGVGLGQSVEEIPGLPGFQKASQLPVKDPSIFMMPKTLSPQRYDGPAATGFTMGIGLGQSVEEIPDKALQRSDAEFQSNRREELMNGMFSRLKEKDDVLRANGTARSLFSSSGSTESVSSSGSNAPNPLGMYVSGYGDPLLGPTLQVPVYLQSTFNVEWQLRRSKFKESAVYGRSYIHAVEKMANACSDFISVATDYSKIIFQERCLSPEDKSIKSNSLFGGQLGGEKYRANGIYFKFASDEGNFFKVEQKSESAAKVAGRDLLGLECYMSCNLDNVHFPLMILLDYLGHRLVSMPVLPIDNGTLVYGSSDGAKTIHNKNPELMDQIKLAGEMLNLKPYSVGEKELFSAFDLEGHVGKDGKFYLLDFSRAMPPDGCFSDGYPASSIYYNFLRPEAVKGNSESLCPDTFNIKDEGDYVSAVKTAAARVKTVLIPNMVKSVQKFKREDNVDLVTEMHWHGVNVRHLGLVSSQFGEGYWHFICVLEGIVRVLKHYIRNEWRNLDFSVFRRSLAIRVAVLSLNRVFADIGNDNGGANTSASGSIWSKDFDSSDDFWNKVIFEGLKKRFKIVPINPCEVGVNSLQFKDWFLKKSAELDEGKGLATLFYEVCRVTGIILPKDSGFAKDSDFQGRAFVVCVADIDLQPVVKAPCEVSQVLGTVQHLMALSSMDKSRVKNASALLKQSLARFPNNGSAWWTLAELYLHNQEPRSRVEYCIMKCEQCVPLSAGVRSQLANTKGRLAEKFGGGPQAALLHYRDALKLDESNVDAMYNVASCSVALASEDKDPVATIHEAEVLLRKVITREDRAEAYFKLGQILERRDKAEALLFYRDALRRSPQSKYYHEAAKRLE